MIHYLTPFGEKIGFVVSIEEDPTMIRRIAGTSTGIEFTEEAIEWLADNIGTYTLVTGYKYAYITIPDERERFIFKMRWYR